MTYNEISENLDKIKRYSSFHVDSLISIARKIVVPGAQILGDIIGSDEGKSVIARIFCNFESNPVFEATPSLRGVVQCPVHFVVDPGIEWILKLGSRIELLFRFRTPSNLGEHQ
ncbi:MAG: hypothetical protein H5T41_04945 [Methanomassiliicoccales archaeon]|nr:hypothetical protein [Methanomassiliicoccales archaeon]